MRGQSEQGEVLRLPLLGVDTAFVTKSSELLDILADEYGSWAALRAIEGLVRPSRGEVHVSIVDSAQTLPEEPVSIRIASPDVLEVVGGGVRGSTDVRQLLARVELDRAWLGHPRGLLEGIVEPLVLFLLGAQDRVPLHAAAFVRGDVGVVLSAPSGTGKSTLVHAASRHGWEPLGDDPVYIQVEPRLRVWGRRSAVHLRPEASEHFPDLARVPPRLQSSGKMKLVVDAGGSRRYVERVCLCVLRRKGADSPRLRRIPSEQAIAEITTKLDPGFDLFRDVLDDRVRRIAASGAWHLELGGSPFDAIPLLDEMVGAIETDD